MWGGKGDRETIDFEWPMEDIFEDMPKDTSLKSINFASHQIYI